MVASLWPWRVVRRRGAKLISNHVILSPIPTSGANSPGPRRSEVAISVEFEYYFFWSPLTQTVRFYARHGDSRIRCAVRIRPAPVPTINAAQFGVNGAAHSDPAAPQAERRYTR